MKKNTLLKAVFPTVVLTLLATWGLKEMRESREASRLASCANDVIFLHWAVHNYATEHDGLFPPIDDVRGNLMVESDGFYPKYLDNSCWIQCEYSPVRREHGGHKNGDLGLAGFTDDSFVYLPWTIRNEQEGVAFVEAYRKLDLLRRDEDIVVVVDGEDQILPRIKLSESQMKSYQAALQGEPGSDRSRPVPYLIEWPDHAHDRAVVTFTNGSRQYMSNGDGYPMGLFVQRLREIASIDRPVPDW
jgi:hypothetical protein